MRQQLDNTTRSRAEREVPSTAFLSMRLALSSISTKRYRQNSPTECKGVRTIDVDLPLGEQRFNHIDLVLHHSQGERLPSRGETLHGILSSHLSIMNNNIIETVYGICLTWLQSTQVRGLKPPKRKLGPDRHQVLICLPFCQ